MVYVIELIESYGKITINAIKKDFQGVEYGFIYQLSSVEEAEEAIRRRWKFQGSIKVEKAGIVVKVLEPK